MNTSFDKILNDMVKVYDEETAVNVVESGENDLSADDLEKKLSDMIDKKLSEVAKNTEKKGEEKKEENIGTQKPQTADTESNNEGKESED